MRRKTPRPPLPDGLAAKIDAFKRAEVQFIAELRNLLNTENSNAFLVSGAGMDFDYFILLRMAVEDSSQNRIH